MNVSLPAVVLVFAALPGAQLAAAAPTTGARPAIQASRAREAAPAPVAQPAPLVLALPFAPIGTPDPDWLSAGLAAYVAEGLELAGYRFVDPEERDDALEAVGLEDEPRLTLASACALARRVGARYVVTGTHRADASRLDLSARMIDVQELRIVRECEAGGHISGLSSVLGQVVLAIAGDGARAGSARQALEKLATTKQDVLMAWMQAAAEPEQAATHLDAALKSDPYFAPALLDLAEARLDAGEPEGVPRILGSIPPGGPESRRSRIRLLEGRALLALGDHQGAISALSDSVALSPQPDRMLWLADAQLAAGRRDDAAATARRVLAIVPEDERAEDVLAEAEGRVSSPSPAPPGASAPSIQAPGAAE